MKTFPFGFLIAFLALVMSPALSADMPEPFNVGDYYTPFSGPTLEGEEFDLAEHYNTGKYIFINYWASW